MLKRIYDWCIAAADKPYALWLMGAVSFAESSFFPIPPDVMLIPMSLARPQKAWLYALVCTVTSVAGGVVGYGIGALLYDSVGQWLINLYGYGNKVEAFRAGYSIDDVFEATRIDRWFLTQIQESEKQAEEKAKGWNINEPRNA